MSTVRQQPIQEYLVPMLALMSGVLAAILYWWSRGSLWEDEIIAITHGLQPLPGFFVEVLRNDIHPFFYFLLLKIWASFNPGSDAWALASSLLSCLLSALVIGYITQRIHGRRAAIWAVALFCILPSTIAAAGNLRMYGLVPGIAMACWYANREFLHSGQRQWIVVLILLQLVQTYIHAIGFFFAAFFALAALVEQKDSINRQRFLSWLGAQTVSLLLMLPVVGSALIRGTEPLPPPSIFSLLSYPANLITGGQVIGFPFAFVFGELTFFLLLALALTNKSSRTTVLIVPCGILLACILISSLGKPMFKPAVFAANILPFLAFGAAAAISQISQPIPRLVINGSTLFLSAILIFWSLNQNIPENYKPAASHIIANAKQGDVVIVPNVSVYWGILRYAVASDWGQPLTTMPLESNDAWSKLKKKLGPVWVELLELNPKTDHVDSRGIRFVIGTEAQRHFENEKRAWVVHRASYKETVNLGIQMNPVEVVWFGKELSVSLLQSSPDGDSSIKNPGLTDSRM